MKKGKEICNELKAVRRSIAEENGIPLEIPECTYEGPCRGTCPRCEAEVQYLESELEKRIRLGKVATVAGLTLALAASTAVQAQSPQDNKASGTEVRTPQEKLYPVRGTIVDSKTKEPMPLCNVIVTPINKQAQGLTPVKAYTDWDGIFKMELPEGNYTMRVAFWGYKDIEKSLKVAANNDTLDLSMEPSSAVISDVIICGLYEQDLILEMGPDGCVNTEMQGVPLRVQY